MSCKIKIQKEYQRQREIGGLRGKRRLVRRVSLGLIERAREKERELRRGKLKEQSERQRNTMDERDKIERLSGKDEK